MCECDSSKTNTSARVPAYSSVATSSGEVVAATPAVDGGRHGPEEVFVELWRALGLAPVVTLNFCINAAMSDTRPNEPCAALADVEPPKTPGVAAAEDPEAPAGGLDAAFGVVDAPASERPAVFTAAWS